MKKLLLGVIYVVGLIVSLSTIALSAINNDALNFIRANLINRESLQVDGNNAYASVIEHLVTVADLTIDSNGLMRITQRVKTQYEWHNSYGDKLKSSFEVFTTYAAVYLANLSPNVEVKQKNITLECTNIKCWEVTTRGHTRKTVVHPGGEDYPSIRRREDYEEGKKDFSVSQTKFLLLASSEEMAQRLVKAFSDLIRSAGGKESKY